jgi:hypothetical protein
MPKSFSEVHQLLEFILSMAHFHICHLTYNYEDNHNTDIIIFIA